MERRDFIRIVTSVYASNTLLATLTTSAQAKKLVMKGDKASFVESDETEPKRGMSTGDSETVAVSNKGTNLILDISGRPRRFAVVLYKLIDKNGAEQTYIQKIARIRKPRVVSIAVNLTKGLDMEIPFMVVTSDAPTFDVNNRGTDWFSVRISSAQPESGNPPQNHATVPEGEHQKVVRYGITDIQRRSFAPLKRL
jgi:hypothetical protein